MLEEGGPSFKNFNPPLFTVGLQRVTAALLIIVVYSVFLPFCALSLPLLIHFPVVTLTAYDHVSLFFLEINYFVFDCSA